ncbi:PqiC family protein [Erwinia psidii]|uniref:Membrane integrity-associated transporter subunit PqiC n=1 Tax=Erwinia psidii TaxID=69224 RepID=A0A3N6SGJ6_9GAMM|nr:PqiC family protein [Erwinia psidii]MCX8959250.1 membrane integrity-associated transporter subunit PqiC [Erwinia psidii]MCX8962880.1 membrane integrity-associated transporter subunit PqiC [Erwinia psidii]RQM36676.1 membrane integrity-associated transporter subunit PqiC [Erwinia psidii]
MKSALACYVLLLSSALTACSSPPVHYHTLNVAPTATGSARSAPFVIYLLPTGVPPQLDMPQLVVMTGNDRVSVLDNDRWLSPVGDEFQTALSSALTTLLNTQDVSGIGSHSSRPVLFIRVQIRRFDSWPGQFVKLQADWSLRKDGVQQVCRTTLVEDAAGGMDEMFSAQQKIVRRLAEVIARQARQSGVPVSEPNLFCE